MIRSQCAGLMILAACIPGRVCAQDYPNKTIRLIMPYAAGGSSDISGRIVMQAVAENVGQPVVIDNRPGAGGTVGTELAARAAPDGYTLVMGGNGTLALSPHLQRRLPYDPVRDFTPVTQLVIVPYVLVVNPTLPAHSVKELIALSRARPDQINYASGGGSGSASHLACEMFKTMANVRLVHVPYKGSTPGINDVIGGQVPLIFTGIPSVMSQIRSGRLRPLAVTTAARATALPDVPTISESGVPGYEFNPWFGVLAPAGTPPVLVNRLNSEIVKALRMPTVRERFATEGVEQVGNTPAQFASYIKHELAKWGKFLKDTGIRAD